MDHHYWAKEILKELVNHIKHFTGGKKYLTYGELAKRINYHEPHKGSLFGKNIGITLGRMGHMFDGIFIDGQEIPLIQTLVVNSNSKLPSDGLKEFNKIYPELTKEKKRDFVNAEFDKIFKFGNRWEKLLKKLGVDDNTKNKKSNNRYNPYGSEGSPEHIALRNYIAQNPKLIGYNSQAKGIVEYPLKSGDKIDVVFELRDRIVGVEIKSKRSGDDDLERGLYQCIKYNAVLEAEKKAKSEEYLVNCILVVEDTLPKELSKLKTKLNLTVFENIHPENA